MEEFTMTEHTSSPKHRASDRNLSEEPGAIAIQNKIDAVGGISAQLAQLVSDTSSDIGKSVKWNCSCKYVMQI